MAERAPFANRLGFTLIELMIVMVILSVTAGLVLPRIGAGWQRMEDREFIQEFVQTLRRARLRSMNTGDVVVFRIRGSDRVYGFEDPLPIPENVDLFAERLDQDPSTGDNVILFFPDGSISGSNLDITFDQLRTFRIIVHPIFGTVEFFRLET
jgi:prepilin-type N-terminal cleavage/methylation domain-containing protein